MKARKPILQSVRILDQVIERVRYFHYNLSTEKTCVYWIKLYIRWHERNGVMQHPREMGGGPEVEAFLTVLAFEAKCLRQSTIKH
jgi:hypothetical protein